MRNLARAARMVTRMTSSWSAGSGAKGRLSSGLNPFKTSWRRRWCRGGGGASGRRRPASLRSSRLLHLRRRLRSVGCRLGGGSRLSPPRPLRLLRPPYRLPRYPPIPPDAGPLALLTHALEQRSLPHAPDHGAVRRAAAVFALV